MRPKYSKKEVADQWRGIAVCPWCEEEYEVLLPYQWTGRGKPRIYHKRCVSNHLHRWGNNEGMNEAPFKTREWRKIDL